MAIKINIKIPCKKLLVAKSSSSNNIWSLYKDNAEGLVVDSRVRYVCNLPMVLKSRMALLLS